MQAVIVTSVRIKADVVAADERERGMRKTLNFGHTIGHALELLSGFTLRHGEAVGIGMVLEARAGERAGVTEPGTADAIADLLASASLPTARPDGPTPSVILDAMRGDKKSRAGFIEYAVPARIGAAAGSRHRAIPSDYADDLMLEVLA